MSMTNPSATLGGVEDRHAELIRVDHPEYGSVYEVNPQPGGTLLLEPSVGPSRTTSWPRPGVVA